MLAQKVVQSQGDFKLLGRHWLEGFMKRHPELKTKRGTRIEYKRIDGASSENIDIFFRRLE